MAKLGVALGIFWTLLPFFCHPNVSLDVAEIVSWGHQWQNGYYKHPPLIAWISEAARILSGNGRPWAIYLVGQLVILMTYYAVWKFSRRLLPAETAFLAPLSLAATFVCTIVSLEFNHNTLLLPFFALVGWSGYESLVTGKWKWWISLGLSIGLGMLSKYEMFFLALPLALFILLDPTSRQCLKGPKPYVALAISLLVFAPNFKWLIDHHFVSLTYAQSRMTGNGGFLSHFLGPLAFLGDQALFIFPILLVLIPWIGIPLLQPSSGTQDRWNRRFLLLVGLAPVSLFLLMSLITGNTLRGAWGVPLIPFVPIMLLVLFRRRPAPQAGPQARSLAYILIAILALVGILQPLLAPRIGGKRPLRVQFPGQALATAVDTRWQQQNPGKKLPIIAGERWLADNVAFYSPDRPSVLCDQGNILDAIHLDEANCPWISVAQLNQHGGMLVWNAARDGTEIPASLREACPTASNPQILELPWQTSANVPPVRVGIAIVPAANPL